MLKPMLTHLLVGALLSCSDSAGTTSLNGRSFYIDSYHNNHYYSSETLVFEAGTMRGSESIRYGFQPAAYEFDDKGRLRCTMNSATNGVMTWEGKLEGNSISGTIVWSRDSQETVQYNFSGKEK